MEIKKLSLNDAFKGIDKAWTPKIAAQLNGQHLKVAKFEGSFIKHSHPNEDELFMVFRGTIFIELNNETIELNEGELVVIPKGVEHRPYAEKEAQVILFEPASTINTGELEHPSTKKDLERL